jgi:hypothetical protein
MGAARLLSPDLVHLIPATLDHDEQDDDKANSSNDANQCDVIHDVLLY